MLPDEKIKCHETGFQETCFKCVTDYKCRKWSRVTGKDKDTGNPIDLYDCKDHWASQIQQQSTAQLSMQLDTIASSIDKLRVEVQNGHDSAVIGGIAQLNKTMVEARVALAAPNIQKLIGD